MTKRSKEGRIAVRLHGGIGDHILGMRLLRFIKAKFPSDEIVAYSDGGGNLPQLEIASLSPYVSRVIPIFTTDQQTAENLGDLANIRLQDLETLNSAKCFFDAEISHLFLPASRRLGFPIYEILAARPPLRVSGKAIENAKDYLEGLEGKFLVALNFAKYGGMFLERQLPWVQSVLQPLIRRRDLAIISIFSRSFQYPHWPAPQRQQRLTDQIEEADAVETHISNWGPEVREVVDAPLTVVAAVLKQCSVFVGVDNGIKHLAWALGVPLVYFMPSIPDGVFILRWMPDFHRMFVFGENRNPITASLEPFLR
jgi:hypothetical protein